MNWLKFANALQSWGVRCAQHATQLKYDNGADPKVQALINRKLIEGNIAVMLHHCIKAGLEK